MQITLQSQQENRQLINEVSTDALTNVSNRRAFDQFSKDQFLSATSDRPVSVLFLDIDHFKTFNDTHSHALGDRVLVAFAKTLQKATSERGQVFRYGGEEFAIVCPGANGMSVTQIAEQARRAVETDARVNDDGGGQLCVTCSIGVATQTGDTFDNADKLVKAADQALYDAKSSGRNCVRTYLPQRDHELQPFQPFLNEVTLGGLTLQPSKHQTSTTGELCRRREKAPPCQQKHASPTGASSQVRRPSEQRSV